MKEKSQRYPSSLNPTERSSRNKLSKISAITNSHCSIQKSTVTNHNECIKY